MHFMKKEMFFPIASLLVCAALYLVWPLAHTIALRKLLLVMGALIGVVLWSKCDTRGATLKSPWLIFLGLLLAWVVFHAGFISQNGTEAWSELLGQWIPAYLAVLAAIGLAIARKSFSPDLFRIYLLTVLSAQPVLFLIVSVAKNIQAGHLVTGFMMPDSVLLGTDLKTSLTFSSDLLGVFACARFLDMVKLNTGDNRKYLWLLPISLAMYVAISITTLNSILLLSVSIIVMMSMIVKELRPTYFRGLIIAVVIAMPGIIYSAKEIPSASRQWDRAISTTKVAVDIDRYSNWINFQSQGLPKNELGEQVPESFYLRVAYATAGFRIILEHPWGYGVTRHAFERLIQQEHPEASIANAHNSYINLVCAVGFPGLLLLSLVIVSVYKELKKYDSEWKRPITWMLTISLIHWGLDAIERDHFFECYLFLIALLATIMTSNKADNECANE